MEEDLSNVIVSPVSCTNSCSFRGHTRNIGGLSIILLLPLLFLQKLKMPMEIYFNSSKKSVEMFNLGSNFFNLFSF